MSYRPCDKETVGCVYLGPHNKCIVGGVPIAQLDGQPDLVNHPPHYKQGGIETIEVIEAWELGFNLGNCVKYVSRAGKKDPAAHVEDLKKARFYLDREIANLERRGTDD